MYTMSRNTVTIALYTQTENFKIKKKTFHKITSHKFWFYDEKIKNIHITRVISFII